MSNVVAFRERIMGSIKAGVPELREVEWYDGMFDEHDVSDWALMTPCAVVSVMDAPAKPHSTGELNVTLRVVVVTVVQDARAPRDADKLCWDVVEKIAVLAQHNQFDDPNAGTPTNIKFKRLSVPSMRREGIALGITEWHQTLTFGVNSARDRLQIRNPETGEPIMSVPEWLGGATVVRGVAISERETLQLSEDAE